MTVVLVEMRLITFLINAITYFLYLNRLSREGGTTELEIPHTRQTSPDRTHHYPVIPEKEGRLNRESPSFRTLKKIKPASIA
ncbi:hypothetical protein VCR1J2_240055 [Vibrio coralliirubri]|nr:hypothetical protein VCR1J2_240055 [Vibrio coralliirubri]CDT96754.1 hypothetical protein VCR8J2_510055 [Vibrio coralliirubri]